MREPLEHFTIDPETALSKVVKENHEFVVDAERLQSELDCAFTDFEASFVDSLENPRTSMGKTLLNLPGQLRKTSPKAEYTCSNKTA